MWCVIFTILQKVKNLRFFFSIYFKIFIWIKQLLIIKQQSNYYQTTNILVVLFLIKTIN